MTEKYETIKQDLQAFFNDWKSLTDKQDENISRIAQDIVNIYTDASNLLKHDQFHEDAELIVYLFSTPWGAPFVSQSTLIQAAKKYLLNEKDEELVYLLKDFKNYTHMFDNQIYCILQDLQDDIEQKG